MDLVAYGNTSHPARLWPLWPVTTHSNQQGYGPCGLWQHHPTSKVMDPFACGNTSQPTALWTLWPDLRQHIPIKKVVDLVIGGNTTRPVAIFLPYSVWHNMRIFSFHNTCVGTIFAYYKTIFQCGMSPTAYSENVSLWNFNDISLSHTSRNPGNTKPF